MHTKSAAAALSVLLLAGCDRSTPTEISPDNNAGSAKSPTVSAIRDEEAAPRFSIDLRAVGSVRIGTPIHLRAATTAQVGTSDVELRLALPELEYAQATSWQLNQPSGALVRGARSARRKSLGRSQMDTRDTSVVIDRPGLYRVVASAIARSADSARVEGRPVQDAAHAEIWLLVDSTASRVVNEYDPSVIPDRYVATPGPFRLRRPLTAGAPRNSTSTHTSADRAGAVGTTGALRASSAASMNGDRRLVYYDYDTGTYLGVPQVTVAWQFYDIQYGGPTGGGSTVTDNDGYFGGACPYWFEYATGAITYSNARIHAGYGAGVSDQYYEGAGGDCNTYWEIIMPSTPSRVYHRMTEAATASGVVFGFYRPQLTVEVRPVANSRYESYYDKVVLTQPTFSGGTLVNNGGVWGAWGRFVMGHEFGHAAHEKAFGGGVLSPNCPDPHLFTASNGNYNCAFSEGFAHYHALETVGTAMGFMYSDLVGNVYYQSGSDGGTWEGPVAAALWHLTRSSSMNGAFTANYYAQLMRGGCLLYVPGDWSYFVKPQGIDHMVYCLERQSPVNSTFQWTYFGARNPTSAISWSTSAPNNQPTQSAIRAVWGTYLRGTPNIPVP